MKKQEEIKTIIICMSLPHTSAQANFLRSTNKPRGNCKIIIFAPFPCIEVGKECAAIRRGFQRQFLLRYNPKMFKFALHAHIKQKRSR